MSNFLSASTRQRNRTLNFQKVQITGVEEDKRHSNEMWVKIQKFNNEFQEKTFLNEKLFDLFTKVYNLKSEDAIKLYSSFNLEQKRIIFLNPEIIFNDELIKKIRILNSKSLSILHLNPNILKTPELFENFSMMSEKTLDQLEALLIKQGSKNPKKKDSNFSKYVAATNALLALKQDLAIPEESRKVSFAPFVYVRKGRKIKSFKQTKTPISHYLIPLNENDRTMRSPGPNKDKYYKRSSTGTDLSYKDFLNIKKIKPLHAPFELSSLNEKILAIQEVFTKNFLIVFEKSEQYKGFLKLDPLIHRNFFQNLEVISQWIGQLFKENLPQENSKEKTEKIISQFKNKIINQQNETISSLFLKKLETIHEWEELTNENEKEHRGPTCILKHYSKQVFLKFFPGNPGDYIQFS